MSYQNAIFSNLAVQIDEVGHRAHDMGSLRKSCRAFTFHKPWRFVQVPKAAVAMLSGGCFTLYILLGQTLEQQCKCGSSDIIMKLQIELKMPSNSLSDYFYP